MCLHELRSVFMWCCMSTFSSCSSCYFYLQEPERTLHTLLHPQTEHTCLELPNIILLVTGHSLNPQEAKIRLMPWGSTFSF